MKYRATFEITFSEEQIRKVYVESVAEMYLHILRGGDITKHELDWGMTMDDVIRRLIIDCILGQANHGADIGEHQLQTVERV
jgi:hypothetical protein